MSCPTLLSHDELAAYRRDGFVAIHRQLLDGDKLARLTRIGEQYLLDVRAGQRSPALNVPHFDDHRLFEFLMDGGVLDHAAQILGSDLALWTSQFFCKDAGDPTPIPWHADSDYWNAYITPVKVVSLWLALDDVSRASGCVRMLRAGRSHGQFHYESRAAHDNPLFARRIRAADIDPAQVVDIELRRGEFVIFDGTLVHGSEGNRSSGRRLCFTMRYMSTACRFSALGLHSLRRRLYRLVDPVRGLLLGKKMYRHHIYLARGRDRAGNEYTPWN
jgi:ectoine hydroxylase-related dioxygenase (phytanoyl-CoA dioxygenase family)